MSLNAAGKPTLQNWYGYMKQKDYSWRGSWNAGLVLTVWTLMLGVMLLLLGFASG